MSKLVSNYVSQPVMSAAQRGVERRQPDFNLVIKEKSGPVRIVFTISEDYTDLAVRFIVVERCDRFVDLFGNSGDDLTTPLTAFLIVNFKIFTFNGKPREMIVRIIVKLRTCLPKRTAYTDKTQNG
jgi:hypothetical protein